MTLKKYSYIKGRPSDLKAGRLQPFDLNKNSEDYGSISSNCIWEGSGTAER
jgi:hypothetical protein